MGGIYLIRGDDELVELTEQAYDSEDILQKLLADHPNLLAGDQIDSSDPRRWLLITREMKLPSGEGEADRWSVDHLFLDQDGIPTLVEVKRSSDTRLRREVVGQLLEYAANAVAYWPVERIQAEFGYRCEKAKQDPDSIIGAFLSEDEDPETFWEHVRTNLEAGKIRLVFVADVIPSELRRIVEFLNEQMSPADVIAVEVKQYAGGGERTLIPRVIGVSERKAARKEPQVKRRWDEDSLLAEMERVHGSQAAVGATRLLEGLRALGVDIRWGRGAKYGSFVPRVFHNGRKHQLFAVYTDAARIELYFFYYRQREPFTDDEKRRTLLDKFRAIPGVSLPDDAVDKLPNVPLKLLAQDGIVKEFMSVIRWLVEEIRKT